MKKLFNLLLIITLFVISLGLNNVEIKAEAGGLNKSRTLVNLTNNGDSSLDSDSDGLPDYWYINTSYITNYNILSDIFYFEVLTDTAYVRNIGSIYNDIGDILYFNVDFYNLSDSDLLINFRLGSAGVSTSNIVVDIGGISNYSSLITTTLSDNRYTVYMENETVGYSYGMTNFMVFNLTDLYGAGNEPTQTEFEAILADAPEYFEEWTYNYYEADDSIGEFACERTLDNLIENGDFSDGDLSYFSSQNLTLSIIDYTLELVGDNTNNYQRILLDNNYIDYIANDHLYLSVDYLINDDVLDNPQSYLYDNTFTVNFIPNFYNTYSYGMWDNYSGIAVASYDNNNDIRMLGGASWTDLQYTWYIDNVMLFNLTSLYGLGNEPTKEWIDGLIEREGVEYFDSLVYDDYFYATVEQTSPLYQYYENNEGISARLDLTLTDTILEMDTVNPLLYVVKYDLDMNYEGVIYDGNISTVGVNAEGYTTHSIELDLPSPVTDEEGYIYVAYDELGGKVLGSGYVFASISSQFNDYNVIGINNSPYVENATGNQFSGEYSDYMFNDYITIHSIVDTINYPDAVITFYSENTDQVTYIDDYITNYTDFCDLSYRMASPIVYECVFYVSKDEVLPPLINFLNTETLYTDYLSDSIDNYYLKYTDLLHNGSYADNEGVYTYGIEVSGSSVAIGETPLYYFDTFHTMGIVSHQIRNGRSLYLDITKDNTYLDDVYDNQYLFDNNTGIYEFDIEDDVDQRIILEVFDGLSPDNATVYYNLNKVDSYTNGADNDYYDISLTDSYVMTSALPFPDKVDNFMDDIGMNSVFGKMIIASVTLILVTIGMFLSTKNIIATLLVDFIVIALLTVLGIIPLWVVLFVIMLLFGGLFIRRRGE